MCIRDSNWLSHFSHIQHDKVTDLPYFDRTKTPEYKTENYKQLRRNNSHRFNFPIKHTRCCQHRVRIYRWVANICKEWYSLVFIPLLLVSTKTNAILGPAIFLNKNITSDSHYFKSKLDLLCIKVFIYLCNKIHKSYNINVFYSWYQK